MHCRHRHSSRTQHVEPNTLNPTPTPWTQTQCHPTRLHHCHRRSWNPRTQYDEPNPNPNTPNPTPTPWTQNSTPPISFTSLSPVFVKAQNSTRRNQTQCRPSRSFRCHRHSQSPAPALWSQSRLMGQLFPVYVWYPYRTPLVDDTLAILEVNDKLSRTHWLLCLSSTLATLDSLWHVLFFQNIWIYNVWKLFYEWRLACQMRVALDQICHVALWWMWH